MTININSKTLGHSIGIALGAMNYLYGDSEFMKLLPAYMASTMHILMSLMPWFAMMGISMTPDKPNA